MKTSVFPSGDQPCRYDGPAGVICLAVPPPAGTVHTVEGCPPLNPSIVPSNDSAWSLLLRVIGAVSISVTARVSRSSA